MEAVECGAASLSMVLAYHKVFVPLEELRVKCGVSKNGSKASNIVKAARTYNMEAKGFRCELESLEDMEMPLIIFWEFNHFVVLEGFKNGRAYINDPAMGKRIIGMNELDESFTGVVLSFKPGEGFKRVGSKNNTIASLSKRLENSKAILLFLILIGIALIVPGLLVPMFSRIFIDDILVGNNFHWIYGLMIGMAGTAVFRAGLVWFQKEYLIRFRTKLSLVFSSDFLMHILDLPMEFFAQRNSGEISNRVKLNATMADVLTGKVAETVLDLLLIAFYFMFMLFYDKVLTIFALVGALLNLVFMYYIMGKRRMQSQRLAKYKSKVVEKSISSIQIIETIKSTGSESDFFKIWAGSHAKLLNEEQKMGTSSLLLDLVPTLISGVITVSVLILGGIRIIDGFMTLGILVAFQNLIVSFMTPVNKLVGIGALMEELRTDLSYLDDVYNYEKKETVKKKDTEAEVKKLKGQIELNNVVFGYSRLESPLLDNISLKIKPGSRVALVGSTGSGKSTILNLIAGIYEPWEGQIYFDGIDKNSMAEEKVKNSLSVVSQKIKLFSGNIKENISLWDETIEDEDIINAAKDALIHDVITTRENGYEHQVKTDGGNFSGGEKQRIEIARALAVNPNILLLDEATSALDSFTEEKIDLNIRKRGCTTVIVAHRLSTVKDCDEIIVLDKGEIAQRGTHEGLIKEDGIYRVLVDSESGEAFKKYAF
jgi:NHLM bacteriocin system ABC transporter peptidase/ATP-binding protein